jgi:putative Mn2+ efflux pump MntP
MGILALLLLSIGLSFDTFAVSVSCGLVEKNLKFLQAARIAFFFAFFQALMPVIGWIFGYSIKKYITPLDHWIVFGLLSFVGLKMIYDSYKTNRDEKSFNPQNLKVILFLSFATTIDAFAVGITFAFLEVNLLLASYIIGGVTFISAMLGMFFGKKLSVFSSKKMEIIGGLILIAIGLKILIQHLWW